MSDVAAALLTMLGVALYSALHSLLAGSSAKRCARRLLGPSADRYYRLGYNLLGGLTLLPVLALPVRFPGSTLYSIPLPWTYLTLAVQGLAGLLLVIGLLQTGLARFLGLQQLLQPDQGGPGQLEIRGLYRWVRHPLYTAGLLFIWLSPVMTTSSAALFLGLTVYILIGSEIEERKLLVAFGQAYREYRRCVPRLIPLPTRRPADCLQDQT